MHPFKTPVERNLYRCGWIYRKKSESQIIADDTDSADFNETQARNNGAGFLLGVFAGVFLQFLQFLQLERENPKVTNIVITPQGKIKTWESSRS